MSQGEHCLATIALLAGLFIPIAATHAGMTSPPGGRATAPAMTRPSATTQPAQAASLPPEYSILQTRNPFAHAGGAGPAMPNGAGPGGPGGPEAMFVLRGTVDAGGDFTAFVEDTTAKRIIELAVGAPLGPGRVKKIDSDGIEYEAMGSSRRIEVGQDLGGRVVPPTPASKPAPPQPGPGPQQGPPNGPMPGAGPRPGRGGRPPGAQPAPEQPGGAEAQ